MDIQYGLAFPVQEIKAQGDAWTVEGYASSYGNVDHGGDVVLRGAFDDTIASGRRVRFLLGHDQTKILGTPIDLRSDEKGLWGKFKISKTALGQDVHTLLKDGALDSFSIGYIPTEVEFDGDVRLLKKIELLETSLVAVPMNDMAVVTGVKHVDTEEDKAVWSAAFINDLPDSSFAVILPGGTKDSEGKTTPRSLRKLPHHGPDGAIDMAHLRNAMSREPQTDMPDAMHGKAHAHLQAHMKKSDEEPSMKFDEHLDCVMSEITRLLERTEEIAALRADDGRRLSGAKFQQLKTLRAGVDELLRLETPSNDAPITDTLRLRLAIARRRLTAAGILEHAS